MWEYEVQSALRNMSLPARLPRQAFLLEDLDGIAAVSHWQEVDGPAVVEIREMAIAFRHRRQGGRVADELMAHTLDEITARAIDSQVDEVVVQGMIWHENLPSQRLAAQAGFKVTGAGAPGVQEWTAVLVVAGAT